MKMKWKRLLVLSLAVALLGTNIKSMADEATAESRRFSILSVKGEEAYVTRGSTPNEIKATAGIPVGQGSQLRTGLKSSIYLEADGGKTLKLDSSSEAVITKSSSKSLKITLKSGSMFFNVDQPLEDGEEMNFNAAQTSMSIRGTSGVFVIEDGMLTFYLIEGEVSWNLGNETITMKAGEKAVLQGVSKETRSGRSYIASYQLQGVEPFSWRDLPAAGLEAVLEQAEKLDLTAIGLDSTEEMALAQAQLAVLLQEKEWRENWLAEQLRKAMANRGMSIVRIPPGLVKERRERNRDKDTRPVMVETSREETTGDTTEAVTSTAPETTTEADASTEPETTTEAVTSTEPETTEAQSTTAGGDSEVPDTPDTSSSTDNGSDSSVPGSDEQDSESKEPSPDNASSESSEYQSPTSFEPYALVGTP